MKTTITNDRSREETVPPPGLSRHQRVAIQGAELASGEALYILRGGEVVIYHDGYQPPNSYCVAVGPWSFERSGMTIADIVEGLRSIKPHNQKGTP